MIEGRLAQTLPASETSAGKYYLARFLAKNNELFPSCRLVHQINIDKRSQDFFNVRLE